jgi:hypothetical protein
VREEESRVKGMTIKQALAALLLLPMLSGCTGAVPGGIGQGFGNIDMPQVEENQGRGEVSRLEVSEENIQQVLDSTFRPQRFTWEAVITYYSGAQTRSQTSRMIASDGKLRLEIVSGGVRNGLFICKEDSLYVFDSAGYTYYQIPWTGGVDQLLSLAQISDFYPISQEQIVESRIESGSDGNVLCLTVADEELGLEDEYRFSMDSGIPLQVTSRLEGQVSYTLETTLWDTETVPDQSQFDIPAESRQIQ